MQLRNVVIVDGVRSAFGRGGMESKVQAAELAAAAGIATVIASGTGNAVLGPLVAGEARGTRFRAQAGSGSAYKLWLRFGKRIDATITVEDGVPFARGIASVDAPELAGRPANVEAVHRDRLVLL